MNLDSARRVADAVMYEGYVLYPYRASAIKNRLRWQFGVLSPRVYSMGGGSESWEMQTECLVESAGAAQVDVMVRFLEIDPDPAAEWERGSQGEITLGSVDLQGLLVASHVEFVERANGVLALVGIAADPCGEYLRLRVRIENLTPWDGGPGAERASVLRGSLLSTHTLLALRGGQFVSLMDPPQEAREAVAACTNLHTWPVLAAAPGERDVVLSSPIILYDYPALAPESHGDFCDSTEIDELLTLRTMTLTDQEKREARATDDRAREIIDRSDSIPPEIFERLHGAIRQLQPLPADPVESFFNPPDEAPAEQASVLARGIAITAGDRVQIEPRRRSDSMDFFLAGRVARVAAVHRDVEGRTHVAVALDDASADLNSSLKRFFYFDPDELRPIEKKEI